MKTVEIVERTEKDVQKERVKGTKIAERLASCGGEAPMRQSSLFQRFFVLFVPVLFSTVQHGLRTHRGRYRELCELHEYNARASCQLSEGQSLDVAYIWHVAR
jgi:hypothetical protein